MSDTKITKDHFANLNPQGLDIIFPLSKKHANKYQLIYASQLYGTFFCVFAKLNIKKTKLDSMELQLVNYKGKVNLGLMQKTKKGWSKGKINHELVLHVKAADGQNVYSKANPITVSCNTNLAIITDILVKRELHPIHKNKTTQQQLTTKIFDSEFYGRDGEFVYKKPTTDELLEEYKKQTPSIIGLLTGKTCNETLLTLV